MDAHTFLWSDTSVYRRRYEKAATALVAIEGALRARHPLGGREDEFLALYAALAEADPDDFTVIWKDPFAYFWARYAYELTGWCLNSQPAPAELLKYSGALGTEDPRDALALHLEEFKKFIIALEVKTGATRRFDRPLRTMLPFSIPGTEFSVLGRGPIIVEGVTNSTLEVVFEGNKLRLDSSTASSNPHAPRLVARPVVSYGDFELTLKPETFCVPGVDPAQVLIELPDDYQARQVHLLQAALALVEQHQPAALEHLGELVNVVGFKPPAEGDYSNISFSDLPGAFIVSAVNDPYWMADALIHELLHNRLFFIIEQGELLEGDEDDDPGELYSPWRDDLRFASGLLHAVYVYIGVARFWFSVCASGETSGIRCEYAEDQAVRAVLDLKIGIAQLRRHATFTDAGARLFTELERQVDSFGITLRELNLSPLHPAMIMSGEGRIIPFALATEGCPVSILKSIESHAQQFDVHRQVGDLAEILNLT